MGRTWLWMLVPAAAWMAGCAADSEDIGESVGADAGVDATGDAGGSDVAAADVGGDATTDGSGAEAPLTALALRARELGLDQYVGAIAGPTVEADDGTTATYAWGVDDGPLCLRGDPFRFSVRRGDPERLVIFLQGGGACWDGFCLAVNRAPAGIPNVNALDLDLEANPLRDWSVAYLPYCDGSLFAGDIDHDDDGDGEPDRFHRGLQNLSAALDVAREEFGEPAQILLTGSSAGGYGTLVATILVRVVWPDAEVLVFNDSGIGVARPGDPEFIGHILEQFNIERFIPDDCADCVVGGHISPLIGWTLEQDENIRVAVFTSWYDSIIGDVFLDISPNAFADAVESETGALAAAYPDRYRRFVVDGRTHTALLGDPTGIIGRDIRSVELPEGAGSLLADLDLGSIDGTRIGEVTIGQWLEAFVTAGEGWVDLVEPRSPFDEGSGEEGSSEEGSSEEGSGGGGA